MSGNFCVWILSDVRELSRSNRLRCLFPGFSSPSLLSRHGCRAGRTENKFFHRPWARLRSWWYYSRQGKDVAGERRSREDPLWNFSPSRKQYHELRRLAVNGLGFVDESNAGTIQEVAFAKYLQLWRDKFLVSIQLSVKKSKYGRN